MIHSFSSTSFILKVFFVCVCVFFPSYHCGSTNDIYTWLLFRFFLHPELRNIAALLLRAKTSLPSQLLDCPCHPALTTCWGLFLPQPLLLVQSVTPKPGLVQCWVRATLSVPIKHLPGKTNYFSPFLSLRRPVEQDEVGLYWHVGRGLGSGYCRCICS